MNEHDSENKPRVDQEIDLSKQNQNDDSHHHLQPAKLSPHKRVWNWSKNLSKKQKIILLAVIFILLGGACASALYILNKQPGPQSSANGPVSEKVPSKMTGLMVEPKVNKEQVTAVMIENSPDARPQSGLYDAGVVYEAVAEGGITRFVALYQDTSSKYIGPVRSVRPYYLDFIVPYDAAIAHVGGSPKALGQLKAQNVKDLDQFANPVAYERISSRYPPHNVYTSIKKLNQIEDQKKYKAKDFKGFDRERFEKPLSKRKVTVINIDYSSPLYNVSFKYSKKCNCYKRFLAGAPHKDQKLGKQIAPKVFVAIEMNRRQDGIYSVYDTTGKGKVKIYQNGDVISGSWRKKDRHTQFSFRDKKGKTIKLAPGKTWVSIVEPGKISQSK